MKLISVLIASKLNAYICGDFSLMSSISAGLSLNIQNKSLSKLKQITGLEFEYKVCSVSYVCMLYDIAALTFFYLIGTSENSLDFFPKIPS